jgi:hypothetical protein
LTHQDGSFGQDCGAVNDTRKPFVDFPAIVTDTNRASACHSRIKVSFPSHFHD